MALLVGGEVEAAERAYAWCLATQREDGSWPMKIVGGRGRGRQRRDQHVGLPRGRRAGTTGWSATTRRSSGGSGRRCAAAWTGWSRCSCRSAASRGRRSGTTGGPATVNERRAAGRVVEHLPRAARRRARSPSSSTTRSRSGSWPAAGSGHALREHRDLFLDKSDVLDGLVLPGARRRGPRRGGAGAARRPLGRLRGAGPRRALRRHQPVGDRRRDLRAGAGARRARGPRARAAAARRHAAPAPRRRLLLDRLRLPRRRPTGRRAHDVHRRGGAARGRRPGGTATTGSDIMRGSTLPSTSRSSGSTAGAATQPTGRRRLPTRPP